MGSSIFLPSAWTNSWEKVRLEKDMSIPTERSHQSVERPDSLPSRRSQCTEDRARPPLHVPSTTAFPPSQRALAISTAKSGTVLPGAELPGLALAVPVLPALAPSGTAPSSTGESVRSPAPTSHRKPLVTRYEAENIRSAAKSTASTFWIAFSPENQSSVLRMAHSL